MIGPGCADAWNNFLLDDITAQSWRVGSLFRLGNKIDE